MFQQQVRADSGVERRGHFRGNDFLREGVVPAIVFVLVAAQLPTENAHQHVGAVRGHRRNWREASEEQNAVSAGAGDSSGIS